MADPLAPLAVALPLSPSDPQGNALKVREALGYDVLGGFALYEKETSDGAAHPSDVPALQGRARRRADADDGAGSLTRHACVE